MISVLIFLILFLIGGFWRRMFGGFLSKVPIIKIRFVQHLIAIFFLGSIFYFNGFNLLLSILFACYIQACFWAPGHGMCFDIGRSKEITERELKRYKKTLGYHITELLLPKRFRYGFLYDIVLMFFRYTIPAILFILIDIKLIILGLIVSPIYAFCWTLFEREKDNIKLPNFISYSTALAEFICGGLFYSLLNYFL